MGRRGEREIAREAKDNRFHSPLQREREREVDLDAWMRLVWMVDFSLPLLAEPSKNAFGECEILSVD